MRYKIKLETNQGPIFNWFLNQYLNFVLWFNGVGVDGDMDIETAADLAVPIVAREINWIKKLYE